MSIKRITLKQLELAEKLGINTLGPDSTRYEASALLDRELAERREQGIEAGVATSSRTVHDLNISRGTVIRYRNKPRVVVDLMHKGGLPTLSLDGTHYNDVSPTYFDPATRKVQVCVEVIYRPESGFLHELCCVHADQDEYGRYPEFRAFVRGRRSTLAPEDRYENEYGSFIRLSVLLELREEFVAKLRQTLEQRRAKRDKQSSIKKAPTRYCNLCGKNRTSRWTRLRKQCDACQDKKSGALLRYCIYCGVSYAKGEPGSTRYTCATHNPTPATD